MQEYDKSISLCTHNKYRMDIQYDPFPRVICTTPTGNTYAPHHRSLLCWDTLSTSQSHSLSEDPLRGNSGSGGKHETNFLGQINTIISMPSPFALPGHSHSDTWPSSSFYSSLFIHSLRTRLIILNQPDTPTRTHRK